MLISYYMYKKCLSKSPMFTNFITVASKISLVHTQGVEPRTRAL